MYPPLLRDDLDKVVSLTHQFWRQFGSSRVFITGGTGFVGKWLLEVILHANREFGSQVQVVVLSRNIVVARASAPRIFCNPAVTMLEGNVCDALQSVGKFDLCIHAAGDVGDAGKALDHRATFDSAVIGTRNILDLALRNGASRFLLTSSGAVYGKQPAELPKIPESFTGAPDCSSPEMAYGNGKRAAEWLSCEAAASTSLQVGIARIFALLGPGLPFNGPFAAGNFIQDALKHKPIEIKGDGRPVRSYLYMLDACVWLIQIMMAGKSGRPYNVGSEHSLSLATLAQRVASVAGGALGTHPVSIQVLNTQALSSAGLPPRYVPDTARAQSELALSELTPLDAVLQKTILWSRQALQT